MSARPRELEVELAGNRVNANRAIATPLVADLILALTDLEDSARLVASESHCIHCSHRRCAASRLATRGLSYLDRSRR